MNSRRPSPNSPRRYEINPGVPSTAGAAAHTRGLLNQSTSDLEQAAAILATCPRPLALAAALEDLGCARLADGDRGGAVDAFDRVLRICIDAGAARDAARARMRLRELGIRRRVQSLDRRDPLRPPPLSQLWHRCGDCVEWIIRLIGVANYGKPDSVNGVRESRPREWREIDHVSPMSYGRARVFKKKHDLGSARCIEIIGDCPYVE